MTEEKKTQGLVGESRPRATVSAKVLDKDGNVIADLGIIAGGNLTKKQKRELEAKLKKLKERKED